MTTISFSYTPWDNHQDAYPDRPGTPLGYSVILTDTFPDAPKGDVQYEKALDGVIQLLAGGIELLRKQGVAASEIESRVKAFLQNSKARGQYRRKATIADAKGISDPENVKHRLNPNKFQVRR